MKNESSPAVYLKCGSCRAFIPGKFQVCIYCKTCKDYFHEKCFQTENEEGNEEDFEEDLIPVDNYAELYVGDTTREYAERLLSVKKPGTFLIRYSKAVNQYVLTSINRKCKEQGMKCDHSKISYTEVGGQGYYSLRPGFGRRTLLAAVEINRRYLGLLYPFNSPESDDLNYVEPEQFSNDEEYVEIGDSDQSKVEDTDLESDDELTDLDEELPATADSETPDEVDDPLAFPPLARRATEWELRETSSSRDYDHGDITQQEADQLLADQVEGTFLLRRDTAGIITLSRANHTDCEAAQHFVLHTGYRSVFFIQKKEFPSIEDLVEFYQHIDTSNRFWLGLPLLTEKALCKASEDNKS